MDRNAIDGASAAPVWLRCFVTRAMLLMRKQWQQKRLPLNWRNVKSLFKNERKAGEGREVISYQGRGDDHHAAAVQII